MADQVPEIEFVMSPTDLLAAERTRMANERTLLAYTRTSLALVAAAITLLKFFTSSGMRILGYWLLPAGVLTLIFGLSQYFEAKARIASYVQRR